jgi:hypothetical protein
MNTKPDTDRPVLAYDGKNWIIAIYAEKCTREQPSDADVFDYNEDDDTYYWPDGWYEESYYNPDSIIYFIDKEIIAWQELPPKPQIAP